MLNEDERASLTLIKERFEIVQTNNKRQKLFQVEVIFNFVKYLFGFVVLIFFKQAVNIYSMELNCYALFIVSVNVLVPLVFPLTTLI